MHLQRYPHDSPPQLEFSASHNAAGARVIALAQGESTGRIVRSRDHAGVIISTTHYSIAECGHGQHYHENSHLCLLMQGGDVEVRGSRSYERRAGDLFFYHAGEAHGSCARESNTTNALVEFTPQFLAQYGVSEMQLEAAARENPSAKFLMLKLQQELHANDALTPLASHVLILELVNYSRLRFLTTPPRWVQQVSDVLRANRDTRLTLAELATAANAHPVTISKNFRKYFSCTLGEYQRKLMVERSIPMIKQSRMSLSEIAVRCGFADQSHFTRNFQRFTGFRPSDFRNI